jgi:hypothetical protein
MDKILNEMIPDWLSKLMSETKPVTQEIYDRLGSKNYTSGDPINIGDYVLHALLLEPITINFDLDIPQINLTVIKFKSTEIGTIYELDTRNGLEVKTKIPHLKYIKGKNKIDAIYY